jgi:hypothetical protein
MAERRKRVSLAFRPIAMYVTLRYCSLLIDPRSIPLQF